METTVTAVFEDEPRAQRAMRALETAGFLSEAIEAIRADTPNRHTLISEETADVARGVMLGAAVGGVGLAIGGLFMAGPLELFPIPWFVALLVFGCAGALGGAAIGFLVGSATGHQVQEEYEHMLERGGVLLAVNTDRLHAPRAQEVLQQAGGHALSTSVHARHHSAAQQSA